MRLINFLLEQNEGPIELPDLPFAYDALEPNISKKTIEIHYEKHHQGYVNKLNDLIKGTNFESMNLEDIIKSSTGPIFNNAAQVWNHTFYWNCMIPESKSLNDCPTISKAIDNDLGGYSEFINQFTEAGASLFGSGWVWLVIEDDQLKIVQTSNAEQPNNPILVCDVWEHAYYIDRLNDRKNYIAQFIPLINWEFVEDNLLNLK